MCFAHDAKDIRDLAFDFVEVVQRPTASVSGFTCRSHAHTHTHPHTDTTCTSTGSGGRLRRVWRALILCLLSRGPATYSGGSTTPVEGVRGSKARWDTPKELKKLILTPLIFEGKERRG